MGETQSKEGNTNDNNNNNNSNNNINNENFQAYVKKNKSPLQLRKFSNSPNPLDAVQRKIGSKSNSSPSEVRTQNIQDNEQISKLRSGTIPLRKLSLRQKKRKKASSTSLPIPNEQKPTKLSQTDQLPSFATLTYFSQRRKNILGVKEGEDLSQTFDPKTTLKRIPAKSNLHSDIGAFPIHKVARSPSLQKEPISVAIEQTERKMKRKKLLGEINTIDDIEVNKKLVHTDSQPVVERKRRRSNSFIMPTSIEELSAHISSSSSSSDFSSSSDSLFSVSGGYNNPQTINIIDSKVNRYNFNPNRNITHSGYDTKIVNNNNNNKKEDKKKGNVTGSYDTNIVNTQKEIKKKIDLKGSYEAPIKKNEKNLKKSKNENKKNLVSIKVSAYSSNMAEDMEDDDEDDDDDDDSSNNNNNINKKDDSEEDDSYDESYEDEDEKKDDDDDDSDDDNGPNQYDVHSWEEVLEFFSTISKSQLKGTRYQLGKRMTEKMDGFLETLLEEVNDFRFELRTFGNEDDDDNGDNNVNNNNNLQTENIIYDEKYNQIGAYCDWNRQFQNYLFDLKEFGNIHERRIKAYAGLSNLALDFIQCASTYGRIIISEAETPLEYKTIPPVKIGGVAGGDKYIVHNILFKFAVDSHNLFDNEEAAIKIAGHDLKGLIGYYNLGIEDLHFPMMALVDYLGYRLIAMSYLPINKHTIVYGSSDAGITMHNKNPVLSDKMKHAAKLLNIKSHFAGMKKEGAIEVHSAADLEGHLSPVDGYFYLLDFSRSFPPTEINPNNKNGNLYQLFRGEFLRKYKQALSPDAYSGFSYFHNYNQEIKEIEAANKFLFVETIPNCAAQLDEVVDFKNFDIKQTIHELGINLRFLGILRGHLKKDQMKQLILIEMISRIIKHKIRSALRDTLKRSLLYMEHQCRKTIIDILNLIFGNSPKSEEYFEEIKTRLLSNYDKALSDDEMKKPLKTLLRPKDFNQLLASIQNNCSLKFVRNSKIDFSTTELLSQTNPFHLSDLQMIGVRIRQLNIMALAEGYVLKSQAKENEASTTSDFKVITENIRLCKLALGRFKDALADNPADKVALRELADTSTLLGDMKTADEYYIRAINSDPSDVNTIFKYAVFLEENQRMKKAEEYYLRTLEISPNHDHCLQRYGHFLESQNNPDEAEKFFIRASEIRQRLHIINRPIT